MILDDVDRSNVATSIRLRERDRKTCDYKRSGEAWGWERLQACAEGPGTSQGGLTPEALKGKTVDSPCSLQKELALLTP